MITKNIGISLGSDNTYIYVQKENKIINFKTILAIDISINEIVEVGEKAIILSEKGPSNIILKRPIKKGKIEDIDLTQRMLMKVFKEHNIKNSITNPNVLLAYDNNYNEVEKSAFIETISGLGVKNIFTMDSTKLIAIGIGINTSKAEGNMIVDIGYELTKIGVLSLNNVIEYKYIDIGSNTFDNDISDFLRKKYKITISNNQIEKLKQNINKDNISIKGKNIITGLPKSLTIDKDEVLSCLKNSIINIIEEIKNLLGKISPEIFNDISNKGIVITGGGSMLKGLREKIEEELHIPILETVTPQENIIKGIKEVIDNDITQANKI